MPLVKTDTTSAEVPFDKDKIAAKINAVQANMNTFVGKRNHNPFLWIKQHVTPLIKRLEGGETSPELQAAVFALPEDAVPISNPVTTTPPPPSEPVVESPKLSPVGLNLPIK